MSFGPDLLFYAAALLYVACSVIFIGHLAGNARIAAGVPVAPRLLALAASLHAIQILVTSLGSHVCPVAGVHFAMSVVSVIVCVLYLGLRTRFRVDVVGAFVAPFALTFLLASRFVGSGIIGPSGQGRLESAILPIHVIVNLVGEGLFLLAFAAATLYLLQENRLKQKKLEGLFQRLPPLDALDRAEHKFLLAGFPLLTIGILTGTLWARRVEDGSPAETWRAIFGYVSWFLFAGVLLLRSAAGWRGRRAAYGTIAGFGFALLVLLLYLFRSAASVPPIAVMAP